MELFLTLIIVAIIAMTSLTYKEQYGLIKPYLIRFKQHIAKRIIQYFETWVEYDSAADLENKYIDIHSQGFKDGIDLFYSLYFKNIKAAVSAIEITLEDFEGIPLINICTDTLTQTLKEINHDSDDTLTDVVDALNKDLHTMTLRYQSIHERAVRTQSELAEIAAQLQIVKNRYQYVVENFTIRQHKFMGKTMSNNWTAFNHQLDVITGIYAKL